MVQLSISLHGWDVADASFFKVDVYVVELKGLVEGSSFVLWLSFNLEYIILVSRVRDDMITMTQEKEGKVEEKHGGNTSNR